MTMQVPDARRDDDVDMADAAASPPLGPYDPPSLGHASIGPFGQERMGPPTPPPTARSITSICSPDTPTPLGNPNQAGYFGTVQPDPLPQQQPPPPPPPQFQQQARPRSMHYAAAVEPAPPHGFQRDTDEFSLSDGFTMHSTGSMSVTSTAYAHTMENGRRYQHFRHGRYPIPNDDDEMERENIKHAMLLELLSGGLYYAPIGDNPQNILDIGTGSGAWAIDMGDRFPGAHVRGIDVSPVQPSLVPPNVDFLIDDCEQDDWLSHNIDFVHLRFMAVVLKDVPTMLRRAYESLRPGGWIELQEVCAEPLCDDGTMLPDDPLKNMYDLAHQAFSCFGMNITIPKHLGPMLEAAGFVSVQSEVIRVPIGAWARDSTLQVIGYYQQEAILGLMPVLAGRPFRALGLSDMTSEMTLAMARESMRSTNVHRYFNYYFWFAQKPGNYDGQ